MKLVLKKQLNQLIAKKDLMCNFLEILINCLFLYFQEKKIWSSESMKLMKLKEEFQKLI